jgi:hypothetical protein
MSPSLDLIAEHFSNWIRWRGWVFDELDTGWLSFSQSDDPRAVRPFSVPSKEEVLQELAVKRYGPNGSADARRAWTLMSEVTGNIPIREVWSICSGTNGAGQFVSCAATGYSVR